MLAPGIPPDELERVFTPFYRGDRSRSRETGGVGLGLSIAQAIVQDHGGDVVLENRPGSGLRVDVALPPSRALAGDEVRDEWGVSIRRACRVFLVESTYRSRRPGQTPLAERIRDICESRVRYGYRRVHFLRRPARNQSRATR